MPKISALTSLAQASVDTAADVLPIVDATAPATTKKVTVQALVNAGLAAAAPQGGIFALTGALTVSGQASFADGSAAAPSVKIGDEQNGFYSDGTGSLSVATSGVRVVRFGTVGGTGNYLRLDANNTPLITAVAGATNADIGLASAGTGSVMFATNGSIGNLQWRVNHTASAVNYIQATGAATGNAPSFSVGGSDANVYFNYYTKGNGAHQFLTGGGLQLLVGHVASAVNYAQITGSATGNAVAISAQGSDTNIVLATSSKGTFGQGLYTNNFGQLQLEVVHVASAVNRFQIGGAPTTGSPYILAAGSDTNISNYYGSKGTGGHNFATGAGLTQLFVANTTSAVNFTQITGSATGNAVTISGAGSDANIDFAIAPKGTGVLRFGTHSALAAETVTGYITIKDAAGNTRKLAVVS